MVRLLDLNVDVLQRVKKMRKRAAQMYTKKQKEDNSMAQARQASLVEEKARLESQTPKP
jgi:hypothetical protein